MSSSALLNEIEIMERLSRPPGTEGRVSISPIINLKHQLGPASLDVRLGTTFFVTQEQQIPFLNPMKPEGELKKDSSRYMQRVDVEPDPVNGTFMLHPGEFVLASTLEYIDLPNDVACRIDGRSSWGRMGLQVHSTAGFVEPGFSGTVVYELSNVGKLPIELHVGWRLAQLTFHELTATSVPYKKKHLAKYGGQAGAATSRYFEDPEIRALFLLSERRKMGESPLIPRTNLLGDSNSPNLSC